MDYESLDETQLAALVSNGDQKAFYMLYKEHSARVFNFLFRFTGDYESAQDIMQNVFTKVFKNIGSFKFKSKLSTWITRIAFNEAMNYRKKHSRNRDDVSIEEMPSEPADESAGSSDSPHYEKELLEKLDMLISQLPSRQKTALILSKYEGKTFDEVSQIMGVSKRSAESLVFRAVEYLRKEMKT